MSQTEVHSMASQNAEGSDRVRLSGQWKEYLAPEFEKPYMQSLRAFLLAENAKGKHIFPKPSAYFRALDLTPLDQVKVVVLGQDPYHGDHQAHGLCFSVQPGIQIPPSLVNIYKELQDDIGFTPPPHGFLEDWAKQGVLLLNSVLSVERARAASHQGRGWEVFTDAVIRVVNDHCENVVFLLWGSYAQKKAAFVDGQKHLALKAPHPSPLSAHRGFMGCKHFSKTNEYLSSKGKPMIEWQLSAQV